MTTEHKFTAYLRENQPKVWNSLVQAAQEGLIVIDEELDSVTATNRLLLTYPDLHAVLCYLIDNWAVREKESHGASSWEMLIKGLEHES